LTDEQIKDWKETLKDINPQNDTSIDEKYRLLQEATPETALKILASFNPKNALEIDIAMEYLLKADTENEKLKKLKEILTRGIKYPLIPLRDYIFPVVDKIKPRDYPETEFVILGVSNKIGVFVNEKKKGEEINQSYYRVKKNQFCYNPYRINVGSIGLNPFDYKNQIISGTYNVFAVDEKEIEPRFLFALFKTKRFLDYVNELATGGVRINFKLDYLKSWKIPLPPLEIQKQIVEKIEKQKAIIEGAEKILYGYEVDFNLFRDFPTKYISEIGDLNPQIDKIDLRKKDLVSFIPMSDVDELLGKVRRIKTKYFFEVKGRYTTFKNSDILWAKITPCMENGKCFVAENLVNGTGFGSTEFHVIRVDKNKALPRFIFYVLRTKHIRDLAKEKMTGTSGHKRVPESFL